MKELSIEEKAKAYDEAIKRLRNAFCDNNSRMCEEYRNAVLKIIEPIFPELKESEDEKIRKWIIDYFKENNAALAFSGISNESVIAWLEKQGEQKPVELPKGEDYGIDGLYAAIDILKKTLGKVDGYQTDDGILEHKCAITAVKKLYNQKPAEWSEEDKTGLRDALWAIQQARAIAKDENDMGNLWYAEHWLESLKDRVQPQTRNEWDEDDEAFLEDIICKVESDLTLNKDEKNWLKSLRSKPKQKLSEEDEKMVERCLQLICESDYNLSDKVDLEFWLKSISPQNTWKPSDEQIEALHDTIIYVKDSMFPSKNVLKKLYGQLKKLREE